MKSATSTAVDWPAALVAGTGAGVRVGLLDTGVACAHPDLAGMVTAHYEARVDVEGGRVVAIDRGHDPNEHGTTCAGILARHAPGAEIHSVQIIGDHPRDSPLKLTAGFRFAIDQGWEVITISAGARRASPELVRLAREASENGLIVIAAKDNDPRTLGYPASFANVIGVDMDHFHDPLAVRFHPTAEIEVEASGIYIDAPHAGGGRRLFTGTSFATPHVAAIAARLKERVPGMDGAQFRNALARLATHDRR